MSLIDPLMIDPNLPGGDPDPVPDTMASLGIDAVIGGVAGGSGDGHDRMLAIDPPLMDVNYFVPPPKVRPPAPTVHYSWYFMDVPPCTSTSKPT